MQPPKWHPFQWCDWVHTGLLGRAYTPLPSAYTPLPLATLSSFDVENIYEELCFVKSWGKLYGLAVRVYKISIFYGLVPFCLWCFKIMLWSRLPGATRAWYPDVYSVWSSSASLPLPCSRGQGNSAACGHERLVSLSPAKWIDILKYLHFVLKLPLKAPVWWVRDFLSGNPPIYVHYSLF